MKRATTLIILILCMALLGCSGAEGADAPKHDRTVVDVDITEKLYVSFINEIYTNTADYVGQTIRIEGMFTSETIGGKTYYYVYRRGPGCCGNDGAMCGFEFTWGGAGSLKDNCWIQVVGELETYDEGGKTYLSLDVVSLMVMSVRGSETVRQ